MRKLLALGAFSLVSAGAFVAADVGFTIDNPQQFAALTDSSDSYGKAINSRGTVVGYDVVTNPSTFAATYTPVWSRGGGKPIALAFPDSFRFVQAVAVSENEIIAGYAQKPGSCCNRYQLTAVMWDATGTLRELGPNYDQDDQHTFTNSYAQAISPSGQFIAGWAVFPGNIGYATRWDGTTSATTLEDPCPGCGAVATGVNDAGDVVGYAPDDSTHAILPVKWVGATGKFLRPPPNLFRLDKYSSAQAVSITNDGVVHASVSVADDHGNLSWHAWRWSADGTWSEIPTAMSSEPNVVAVSPSGLVLLRPCTKSPQLLTDLAPPLCDYQLYFDGATSTSWAAGDVAYVAASAATGDLSSSRAYLAGSSRASGHDVMTRTLVTLSDGAPPPPPPVNQAPQASLPTSVTASEGTAATIFATVTDPDGPGPLKYEWDLDGNGSFERTSAGPDIEFTPPDNGSYVVRLRAQDAAGAISEVVATTVVAGNVDPVVQAGNDLSASVGQSVTLGASFSDLGANDGPWSYSVSWGDDSQASTGPAGARIAPSHSYAELGTYEVTVSVTDKDGGVGSATLHISVVNRAPTANPGGSGTPRSYSGSEGTAIAFDGSGSSDPDGDGLTYAWSFGDGKYGTGAMPTHTYEDNGLYTATLTVTDSHGAHVSSSVPVNVANVAPTLGEIQGMPEEPIIAGTPVTLSASFTDPGLADAHTGAVQLDIASGFTTNGVTTRSPAVNSSGTISATVTLEPGVYAVTLRVSDDDDGVDESSIPTDYIVVFDPADGFVTGGGWIWSPSGACRLTPVCVGAQGKATFGFVSKYKKGANVPTGNTEFNFQSGGFRFSATEYEWLVVSGSKAQFKGTGTVNGGGSYGFMLTAIDGDLDSNNKSADKFRIKIWMLSTGVIVYDNQMGQSDNSNAGTILGGGSIQIHKTSTP